MKPNETIGTCNELTKQDEQQMNEQSNNARNHSVPSRLQVTHQGDQPNDETVNLRGGKAKGLTHARKDSLICFNLVLYY